MDVLGISCFYHDAAAALLRDGVIVAAAHEERFSRRRHDQGFPASAIAYCLAEGGISPAALDAVAFYDKPLLKLDRILQTYLATWPMSYASFIKAMPVWINEKMWVPQTIRKSLDEYAGPVYFTQHHIAHAASAFLASPFEEAAILTLDGVGEWDTTTWGTGRGTAVDLAASIPFPHSLGLLYSAFTYYLGFRVNSAEYKVMGLAPYGAPRFYDLIMRELVDCREDGSFHLNMRHFIYDRALRMTGRSFERLFGAPRRDPESPLTSFHHDVAASLQKATDEIVVRLASHVHRETGLRRLALAGGVALNCVANSRIFERTPFTELFVQPAAGDAGGALGAAAYVTHTVLGLPRRGAMAHAFLGPAYDDEAIAAALRDAGFTPEPLGRAELLEQVARLIADQQVVGWFQGRMEYGPRALGARSILADARNPANWQRVNLKIKFRESFRPFAPAVLEEKTADWFDPGRPSPFMLFTAQVRPDRRTIPAVTHVDGSARLQTIRRDDHPLYYDLIGAFERLTGCPVVINTSFNVRGEPIVCSPADAVRCFLRTEMDYLAIGPYLVGRAGASSRAAEAARAGTFEPD